eukprot:CAMPEP_0113473170 /NCGR_PEP_ID=MMETSP0014_2-20120614/17903_1 /TAXON_ID=2857 /ORGANISM="Nitzschia sp." /LENGTH=396 /DNA_ID=CAMNT_0000365923 /DNA_START=532 /DNA_END=1722 /DNA_ORIENTATION=+ /assembly_acc=CAM_ASM_000159
MSNDDTASAAAALASLMARVQAATISGPSTAPPDNNKNNIQERDDHHHHHDDEEDEEENNDGSFKIPQRYTKSGRKRAISFPLKLMKVLSDRNLSHIVAWTPSGRSFVILKPKLFAEEILPEHFKSAKFSSFTRKLHRWGFMRHYRGEEAGAYYHDEFQRGRLDMVEKMSCHKAPPTGSLPISFDNVVKMPNAKTTVAAAASASEPLPSKSTSQPGSNEATLPIPSTPLQAPARFSIFAALKKDHAAPVLQASPRLPVADYQHPLGFGAGLPPVSQSAAAAVPVPPATNALVAAEINAAIELEVSRRLQERINQAASQFAVARSPNMGHVATASGLDTSNRPSLNDSSAALRMKLLQLRQQKEQMERMAMSGGFAVMPARGLPPAQARNVQGAKTA